MPSGPAMANRHATTLPGAQTTPSEDVDIVGAGDVLVIGVDLLPEQEVLKTSRVDPDGNINLFLIGRTPVGGLSFRDAERFIAKRYQAQNFVAHPMVSVNRVQRDPEGAAHAVILKPGDWVSVRIFADPDKAEPAIRLLRVSGGGAVGVPYLGQTQIAGMTEADAETTIVKAFADAGLIRNAMVSVLRVPEPAAIPFDIPPMPMRSLPRQKH
jgi:protein involved in polysaccharide export with SLBB domain